MLQIRCENDLQKGRIQKTNIQFFTEVKEIFGIDFQQCESFEEFKRLYIEKMSVEELQAALRLPNNSLRKETLEELKKRKRILVK